MTDTYTLKCPTCGKINCGSTTESDLTCSRCQSELDSLYTILNGAVALQTASAQALCSGDEDTAYDYALQSWNLHNTKETEWLLFLSCIARSDYEEAIRWKL